jgi:hypothetical protein
VAGLPAVCQSAAPRAEWHTRQGRPGTAVATEAVSKAVIEGAGVGQG